MTTTTAAAPLRAPTPNQAAAIGIWIAAVATTWQAVVAVGVGGYAAVVVACIVQLAFTTVESALFRGQITLPGLLVLALDSLINAGGAWRWVAQICATPAWHMLVESAGAPSQLEPRTLLVVALVLGAALAWLPESVWSAKGGSSK